MCQREDLTLRDLSFAYELVLSYVMKPVIRQISLEDAWGIYNEHQNPPLLHYQHVSQNDGLYGSGVKLLPNLIFEVGNLIIKVPNIKIKVPTLRES